jgi:hypothetical protein
MFGIRPLSSKIDWKTYAEILGIAGVVGSLIFVAVEIQQNTNAVRSATIQAIAALSAESSLRLTENPELRAARLACDKGEKLTEDQKLLVEASYTGLMRLQQNRLQQLKLGVLDEETLFQVGGRGPGYRTPCFTRYWTQNRERFPLDFQEFMESEVLPLTETAD